MERTKSSRRNDIAAGLGYYIDHTKEGNYGEEKIPVVLLRYARPPSRYDDAATSRQK